MDVLRVLAALAAALFVLGAPGLPAVLALRLRPLTALAVVAPLSATLLAVTAEIGHLLGIPWTVLSPLVLGLALGGVLWAVRRPARRPAHVEPADPHDAEPVEIPATALGAFLVSRRGRAAVLVAGLLLGGGYLLARALHMMGSVFAVSQTYDNVFHLNAVRRILRLGDGSAWVVGGMTTLPGDETYYPALWHQTVSLVVQLSGQEIVLASNIVMLLLAAVVWPVGLMALVRTGTTAGPAGWLAAGALAGVASAFPLSMMSWGILLPYLYSLAMMPLVLMLIVHLIGLAPAGPQRLRGGQLAVLLPLVCVAVALAHPQGVFVGLVLGVPVLVWATLVAAGDLVRRRPRAGRRLWVLALVTGVVVVIARDGWDRFRPPQSSAVWEPNATVPEAIGQTLSLSPNAAPAWLPLGLVLAACAIAVLLRSRSRWLLVAFLAAATLSVGTRSTPVGDLRYWLTGNWYSDNNRITVMLAVAAVPLLAVGLDVIVREAARHLPALRGAAGGVTAVALSTAIILLGLLSPSTAVSNRYLVSEWRGDALLSADERALLEQLPEVVPEDAVIATNAWNGSSLAYAISDREVLNIYMGFQAEPEVHLLNAELDDAATNPEVCDAAHELDVEYALDFGPRELHGRSATYTGLNEISETGSAEVVLQVGEAKLLRMLPCRGTDGSMSG